jgi:Flp pilus assembly protein TadD
MRGLSYEGDRVTVEPGEALPPDPEQSSEELARGRDLLARNRCVEAVAACTRAVLLAPDDPACYPVLGRSFLALRMPAEAVACLRTAIELEPADAELHLQLSNALQTLGRREECLAELRRTLELDPQHAKAWSRLAIQRYYGGDPLGAWEAVHRAESLRGEVPPQFRALLARRHPEPAR